MFKIIRFRPITFPFIKKQAFLMIDIDSYSVSELFKFLNIKNAAAAYDNKLLKLNFDYYTVSISPGDFIFIHYNKQVCALPKSSFLKFFLIEEDLCSYLL